MTSEAWNRYSRNVDRRMELAREWDELVDEVRRIDGFQDFLRPPSLESLLPAAAQGPVVLVNVSRWRCDALIATVDGIQLVELPDLSVDEVGRRTTEYLRVLQDGPLLPPGLTFAEALEARAKTRQDREDVLRSTVEWLWDVVTAPVLTALGHTEPPGPDDPLPRLWWCPTGLLTLLPLHGAGYHWAADGRTVLDRVVSSYTPTLRALSEQMSRPSQPSQSDGPTSLLFIGVPEAPEQVQLGDDVAREREFLQQRFPGGLTIIDGSEATTTAVHAAMADHSWVHLSCHGYQDLNNPSAAGFMLSNGTLSIVRLSAARYTGEFAFLSACRTATGGLNLPDEVITLAAALNYTGYRHVVGTLWSVDPAVAAEVTTAVYEQLISQGTFHPELSATAVHNAVRMLRENRRPLDDWLPFTHIGP